MCYRFIILTGFFLLGGCAAPLVMGANLAAMEGFSTVARGSTEVRGSEVLRLANWNNRFDEQTALTFGNRNWTCARNRAGSKVCVPKNEASETNARSNIIFRCTYGTGGVIGMTVNNNSGTLYCRKT